MLESIESNPFRRFLTGEPFSIQSSSPMDLQNLNAQSFQNVFTRIFNSLKRDQTEKGTSFLDKQQEQKQLNDTLCEDDDLPSSSGCSSASSTSGGDDNANSEDLNKMNNAETDNLTEAKNFDSADAKNDLNEITNNKKAQIQDDFNDNFPNDVLDKLPDGLREVIAQIRENTNADIRLRNRESRVAMFENAEENRNKRKAELRAKMLGLPPPEGSNGPINSLVNHSHHPCVDSGGLYQPVKFSPWKLKKKLSNKELQQRPQDNSNILVIDNTKVTLRKKGTFIRQITEDDNSNATSRTEDQSSADPQELAESGSAAGDELEEFNTHNYWYISPSSVDIEKELWLLKSPEPQPQGNC